MTIPIYQTVSSPLSMLTRWVELSQLGAGVGRGQTPIHARPQPVALLRPRLHFALQRLGVRDAPFAQALACQHRELHLHHVQPGTMGRRVDELDLARQQPGELGREGLVEGGRRVGREIVYNQPKPLGPRVDLLDQPAHLPRELQAAPALPHGRRTPAGEGLEGHEDVGHAASLILVVATDRPIRSDGHRLAHLGQELAGALVEADHGPLRIVRLLVEVEHSLHPPDERGALLGRDHPPFDEVGTQLVFLSVFLTVSWEIVSTMPSSTALSARSRMLQRSRPPGASEQARAIRCASARPSKDLSYTRSGAERSSAASSPWLKNRSRTRCTVAEEVSSIPAISRSASAGPPLVCSPMSAFKRTRARLSILAGASPARISFSRRSRSSFVSSTTYFFFTATAPVAIGSPQDTADQHWQRTRKVSEKSQQTAVRCLTELRRIGFATICGRLRTSEVAPCRLRRPFSDTL